MSGAERESVRARLAAGPARGLGCAAEIAGVAAEHHDVLQELVDALGDERAIVVARAANALKKVRKREANALKKVKEGEAKALNDFAGDLLRAAQACTVLEARWNLWLVLGGLQMTGRQRALAADALFGAMSSPSAFERVAAMQALAELSGADAGLRPRIRALLERALGDQSAAVRARARRLRAGFV